MKYLSIRRIGQQQGAVVDTPNNLYQYNVYFTASLPGARVPEGLDQNVIQGAGPTVAVSVWFWS